jgi:hypothetical protein
MIRSDNDGSMAARGEWLEYEMASGNGRVEEGLTAGDGERTYENNQSMDQGKSCISYLKRRSQTSLDKTITGARIQERYTPPAHLTPSPPVARTPETSEHVAVRVVPNRPLPGLVARSQRACARNVQRAPPVLHQHALVALYCPSRGLARRREFVGGKSASPVLANWRQFGRSCRLVGRPRDYLGASHRRTRFAAGRPRPQPFP